MGKILKTLI